MVIVSVSAELKGHNLALDSVSAQDGETRARVLTSHRMNLIITSKQPVGSSPQATYPASPVQRLANGTQNLVF